MPRLPVQVWWADLTAVDRLLRDVVSVSELARADSYVSAADRGRSLLGAALLRLAAATELGIAPGDVEVVRCCEECGGEHGRPRVAGVELSLSHAGVLTVVAAARLPVGVDVERDADVPTGETAADWTAKEAKTKLGDDAANSPVVMLQLATPRPGYTASLAVAAGEPIELSERSANAELARIAAAAASRDVEGR